MNKNVIVKYYSFSVFEAHSRARFKHLFKGTYPDYEADINFLTKLRPNKMPIIQCGHPAVPFVATTFLTGQLGLKACRLFQIQGNTTEI